MYGRINWRLTRGCPVVARLYAIRYVTPLLSELINKLAVEQPVELDQFIIDYLNGYIQRQAALAAAEPSAAPQDEAECARDLDAPPAAATGSARAEGARKARSTPRSMNILLLGMDNAGKSTLLATLQGDKSPNVMATTGFRPVTMQMDGGMKVKFYDLGGGQKIRNIWSNYYHDVHGVVYVLDSAEAERWPEGLALLQATRRHRYLAGKPFLILANKQDQPGARPPDHLRTELGGGGDDGEVLVHGTVAHAGCNGDTVDPRIEVSLEWLFDHVKAAYETLDGNVVTT
jgi:ADP-ribosylation factor-like protein 13B